MGQARQTVERLQLGLTLQRLRTEAGKSQLEAAEAIGRSAGRLSQVENGKGALGADELIQLLDFYGVLPDERATVLALGKASRRRQPRLGYLDTLPDSYLRLMDMLSAASRISWYDCGVFPGLVQSHGYVRALIKAGEASWSDEETAERISFRLDMQRRVLESGKATQIEIVFTEDALLRIVGDESVMREQVLHLLQLLEQHPALSIRTIPVDARDNPGLGAGMVSLEYDTSNPVTLASTIYGSAAYYDQPSDTEPMRRLLSRILELARNQRDSRSVLIDFLARSS